MRDKDVRRHDDGERVDPQVSAAGAAGEAAAADSAGAALVAVPWPRIIQDMPDDEKLRLALLDALDGMERAIPLLPGDDSTRLAFSLMCWSVRDRLGLNQPDCLAA